MSIRPNRSACALAVAVVLGLASAGCSSSGTGDAAAPSTTAAPSSGSSATPGTAGSSASATAASGSIDPRAVEPCEVLDQDQLSELLGSAPEPQTSDRQSYEITCDWGVAGDPRLELRIETERPGQEAYDGVMQYLEVAEGTEPVDLGDVAVVKVVEGDETQIILDAVINGWYVSLTTWGVDDPDALVAVGRDLEAALVAFTAAEGGTTGSSAPSGGSSVAGTLERFEVTIDAPSDLAGTTNTENLGQVGFSGYSTCSKAGDAYFGIAFNTAPAEEPPTPVGVFNITVDQSVDPGETVDAIVGVGTGRSELATVTQYPGTITMGADGRSGTFRAGALEGSWVYEFVE